MQTDNSMSIDVPRRRSSFRTFVILGTLVPAWHSMGMDLFNGTGAEIIAASVRFSRSNTLPKPSSPMEFQATAYCDSGITKSGVPVKPGLVAADPAVLPLGSWIKVEGTEEHSGLYQVMDTGRLVKGKIIDIYLPTWEESIKFGRQKIQVIVLLYGPSKQKTSFSMN